MSSIVIGYGGLMVMIALIFWGIPIAYAMMAVSIAGLVWLTSFEATAMQVAMLAWEKGTDSVLMSIPLFVLMGQLVYQTRIVSDLFDCVRKWAGHLPGGLAVAAVLACAGFGAVTGSTLAAVATMGATIMPELNKYRYDPKLSTGTIAAAGGLATIIPPSVGMILYGILTDTSIAALFIAGIVPGLLLTLIYSLWVVVRCLRDPEAGPRGPRYGWAERVRSLKGVLPVTVLFLVVIGGIYGGVFTPTEAAGIGVVGVALVALAMRRLSRELCRKSMKEAALLGTVIYVVVFAGYLMARFLTVSGATTHLIDLVVGLNMNTTMLIVAMAVLYLVLGCLLDTFGLTILTIPILFPIVTSYGLDPVWFGVFFTLMAGVALMTPPVGMHAYVLHSVVPEVSSRDIFAGSLPFCLWHMLVVALTAALPALVLWLPYSM